MSVERVPPPGHEPTAFAVGDVVTLRSAPESSGAVIQVLPSDPEPRYLVLLDGKKATYYASQLAPEALADPASAEAVLSLEDFQARLTSLQLTQPSLTNLYSLHAARVNFVPYQFRPVLKFIRSDRPRMLIADEVGVGKTIEAGLILRELQARQDIRSVCIICPKPLVTERKWANEMKRFDEDFTHLDGPLLRQCIADADLDGEWPDKYARCIIPFSLFDERLLEGDEGKKGRRRVGLLGLDPPPRFDLVIVDEAHALRNPARFLHQGVGFFLENAEAAVLLSATPIQLHSDDLFVLLNLLRPDVILDKQTFYHMSEPNPHLHAAVSAARAATDEWPLAARTALADAGKTAWGSAVLRGNPDYQRLCRLLDRNVVEGEVLEPSERLSFLRDVEGLNAFSGIINRTRRRDIGNFTTRKPETVTVEFTPEQRALHDALLAAQERILRRVHGDRPMKFLMTTIRRQAASCLYGLVPLVESILLRRVSELDWDEASDAEEWDEGAVDEGVYLTLREEIESVLQRARDLDPTDDPKRDALLRIAREKQALPNKKILLFSSFRHTLRYLLKYLAEAGARVGLIQGDVPDEERSALRNRFSLPSDDPRAIDVLLSSEVGCEGLDYQFCDTLVNYDLNWNPQKIEQRIGRIDRYGQESETVAIYNIVTPGTVDYEIFDRCLSRIGVFEHALGGSEEILGRITREIHSVMENLSLTEEERAARLQQLSDNQIRLLQEQTRLEEQQAELFGLLLPPQQIEQEVRDATSAWLSPSALQNLVQRYLSAAVGGEEHIQGGGAGGGVKTLRLGQEARNRLLEDFRRLPRQSATSLYREWERWLKGNDQRLEVTLDAEAAAARRGVVFVTPIHPLAQQAARHFEAARDGSAFRTAVRVPRVAGGNSHIIGDGVPDSPAPGVYPFAVYQWQRRGVRDDALLQPVCADASVTEHFSALMERARPVEAASVDFPEDAVYQALDRAHHALWRAAGDEHRAQTGQVAAYRRESLRASYEDRAALLREKLANSDNAKIRRMQQSQIARAEADYARRMQEIDAAARRADILFDAVAHGLLIVE